MYETICDKGNFFERSEKQRRRERESSTKQTKQRICRKSHGLLNGFRDLSIVGNSCSITRSSLWRPSGDGSLGDDNKSNSSDCDSQSDDSCLWEIYRSSDTPLYIRSPKKMSPSLFQRTSTLPSSKKKTSSQYSPNKLTSKSIPSPKVPSPMLIASPCKSPEKLPIKEIKSKSSPSFKQSPPKSNSTKEKSPLKAVAKNTSKKVDASQKENSSKTTSNIKSIPKKISPTGKTKTKSMTKPISFYFSKKTNSKFISSPKLNLKSPLRMSTPKTSSRKPANPSKSISQKDNSFMGISFQLTPSLKKNDINVCSNVVNNSSKNCNKEGRFRRHNSMLETSFGTRPSTPITDKYGRFIFSEPRPKRKIDLSSNDGAIFDEEIQTKKARRGIDLEDQPHKAMFFTPLPNFEDQELGVTPMKILKECKSCGTNHTPLWRDADEETPLCNACGIRWKKYRIRCTRCWYIPMKEEKSVPYCPSCGNYGTIKRCNAFRRYMSSIY